MPFISEYKITIVTDDEGQGHMSDEDLETAIDKDVKRWTPGLAIMPMIETYEVEKL